MDRNSHGASQQFKAVTKRNPHKYLKPYHMTQCNGDLDRGGMYSDIWKQVAHKKQSMDNIIPTNK